MKKVVLITGGSSGIGKATVFKLLQEGHIVYSVARRLDEMKDVERAGAIIMSMDLTDEEQIQQVVNRIIEEQGRIDVLINNAGYGIMGAVEDISMEDARRQFEVNLFGLAVLTKAVLPHMRTAGVGRIINTSSMGGKIYTPLAAWYIATKHALEGWSDCLRFELRQHNIDVVIIEPGIIKTFLFDNIESKMIDQAKSGAYLESTVQTAKLVKDQYDSRFASSPEVIGKTIAKAVRVKNPKSRYVKGHMALIGLFGRRILSDKFYDRILRFAMKRVHS